MSGELSWLIAPVAALAFACLVLVPLGTQVLARGIVFIDLAVAQITAVGVLAVPLLVHDARPWVTTSTAAGAALVGSGLVWWLARRAPEHREATIGLVYVAGAGVCVIGAALLPEGRERLTALLAADVLWASWTAVALLATASVAVCALLLARPESIARDRVFYPLFALSLSAAVPLLGLYLVFALLIAPALWARRSARLGPALLMAGFSCAAGLGLSWAFDWPSGACLTVVLCALGIASAMPPSART